MSREVELGWASRTSCFELFKFFINSSATDIVFVTLSKHSSWNSNCAVHKSLGNGEGTPPWHFHCSGGGPRSSRSFSDCFRGRAFTLSSPSHSFPVPNRPSRLRGLKATWKKKGTQNYWVLLCLSVSVSLCLSSRVKEFRHFRNPSGGTWNMNKRTSDKFHNG